MNPPRVLLASLALAVAGPLLSAQQFVESGRSEVGPHLWMPYDRVDCVDLDADGDLDFVAGGRVFIQEGEGFFDRSSSWWPTPLGADAVYLFDADGDGDLDALKLTGSDQQNTLYLNDGSRFVAMPLSYVPADPGTGGSYWYRACPIDADGDAYGDIVVMGPGDLRLLTGSATGQLTDASASLSTSGTWQRGIALDIDADGDQDFLNERVVYVNDGVGAFSADATRVPGTMPVNGLMEAIDIGQDGTEDLVMLWGHRPRLFVWQVDGSLLEVAMPTPSYVSYREIEVADLDSDGDEDLLLVGDLGAAPIAYLNNAGVFTDGGFEFPTRDRDIAGAALADMDGDGDLDLTMVLDGPSYSLSQCKVTLWLAAGPGRFVAGRAQALPSHDQQQMQVVVGDFDGDADPDLVSYYRIGSYPSWSHRLQLARSDGVGRFEDYDDLAAWNNTGEVLHLEAGDIDGDGDLDLLVSDNLAGVRLNDGQGGFSSGMGGVPALPAQTRKLLMIDIEGDTDLDLLVCSGDELWLYVNGGQLQFTDETATRLGQSVPHPDVTFFGYPFDDTVVADIDGDGDQDIVCSRVRMVLVNDGAGQFAEEGGRRLPEFYGPALAEVADFDGNGSLDILLRGNSPTLWLNNGFGFFVDLSWFVPDLFGQAKVVAVADLDADGDLDLIAEDGEFESGIQEFPVWLNDGAARFTEQTWQAHALESRDGPLACADFDLDGDVDLVTWKSRAMLSGTARQTWVQRVAHRGHDLRIEVAANPGRGSAAYVAVPLIGFTPARIWYANHGWLMIDPASLIALPSVFLPAHSGRATALLPLPSDPALQGLELHIQSVLVEVPAGTPRLTNATTTPIV